MAKQSKSDTDARCPFCGGEGEILHNWSTQEYFIRCSECGGRTGIAYTPEKARELWERRK